MMNVNKSLYKFIQLYHWEVDMLGESENTTCVIIIAVGISESIYHSKKCI